MEFQQKSARLPKSAEEKEKWRRVIIILEHCPIKSIQTDKGFELLSEKHRNYHAKRNLDPAEWRPDVVHQCLLQLLDSPLNRAGKLQVFLRTKNGVLIMVDPRLRVPRHMKLFEKMMVQLLFKMRVRSSSGYLTLLREIKNPITDHIPANTQFIRVEKGGERVNIFDFAEKLSAETNSLETAGATASSSGQGEDGEAGSASFSAARRQAHQRKQKFKPFAFVVGGMARGDVEVDYADKDKVRNISLADHGMSAAAVLSMILHGFEECWLREDNTNEDYIF